MTLNVLEGYGRLDVLISDHADHARRDVFEATLAWITSPAGRPWLATSPSMPV